MAEPYKISSSKWKCWTTCHRKAYYRYVLNLEAKTKAVPLAMGDLVHKCLEAYYREGKFSAIQGPLKTFKRSTQDMPDEDRVLFKEMPNSAFRILRGYHLYWQDLKNLTIVEKDGKPLIEKRIEVPLTKDVLLSFKMDLYTRDCFGEWVVDTKTHGGSLPSDDYRTGDVQSAIYYYGARLMGLKPMGMMWNYISSDPPSIPKMTQQGRMSRARIRTDKATFREFLDKQGLDHKDYEEFMQTLSYKDFFRRVRKERPKILVARLMSEVVTVAREMQEAEAKGERAFVRSLNWTCDRTCKDFRTLCLGELQGHDVDFLIKTYYQERRDPDGEENEKEE